MHRIWGKADLSDLPFSSSSDSSSARDVLQAEDGRGPTSQKHRSRHGRASSLPLDIQRHIKEGVIFHEEESGASSSKSSRASGNDVASRGTPHLLMASRAHGSGSEESRQGAYPAGDGERRDSGPRGLDTNNASSSSAPAQQAQEFCGADNPTSDLASGVVRDLPSMGSQLHDVEQCKPCLYQSSKVGCFNGYSCHFCHFPHAKKNRPRPCKAKRTQCKQIVAMLDATCAADPQQLIETSQRLASESAYMRTILQGKHKELLRKAQRDVAGGSEGEVPEAQGTSQRLSQPLPPGNLAPGAVGAAHDRNSLLSL
mmetsp:Transcript_68639/g.154195  ORF Transcript_68639/g.154195 Transcript_68639/m.154195 type:complete len:313 (-) Transcript_68639:103-1041(-)